jgi:sodium pump decarboxylase gamma subunit
MNIPVLIDLVTADVNKPIDSWADRLSAAGQTVVLGMAAVFSVLAILWIVLAIMGSFFTKGSAKPTKKEKPEEKKPAPQTPPIAPAPVVSESDDEEVIAAITAAISVMLDKPQSAFRVVSFRQTSREAFRRNNVK